MATARTAQDLTGRGGRPISSCSYRDVADLEQTFSSGGGGVFCAGSAMPACAVLIVASAAAAPKSPAIFLSMCFLLLAAVRKRGQPAYLLS